MTTASGRSLISRRSPGVKPFLRLDRLILARTGGRLIRISCALCGWDWYLNR